jgi:hypothetical protein
MSAAPMGDERMGREDEFYIVDLRAEWRGKRYVTLWRSNDCGYCFSLPWAGRYSREKVDAGGAYYSKRKWQSSTWERFPVPCAVVDALATEQPRPGDIDGDVGPILLKTNAVTAALRRARYIPERVLASEKETTHA